LQIAILEDDVALNISIKNILSQEGYKVDSYFDGEELFNSNKKYDLYILDIKTPKISGLELIKYYEKVIIISSNITEKNVQEAYKKGAIDFIKKPFFKEELIHKIKNLLPNKIFIKDYEFDIKAQTLKKENNVIQLSKSETKFLSLFVEKDLITTQEIFDTIEKKDNSLYIFISRLKKKTNLNFKNIKREGYKLL